MLVHYFLLDASLLKKLDLGCCLEVLVLLLQGIDHYAGLFFFRNSFFLVVCIRNAARAVRYCRGWV
jgi:hypothetical protein